MWIEGLFYINQVAKNKIINEKEARKNIKNLL